MGYIYLITNTLNGKKYVGQTLCKDVESRWKQHKSLDKRVIGRYLLNAYEKYGIESFKFQIICICFDEDCNRFEENYIQKYNCLVPNGYNLKPGGKNSKHHPETIQKMKDSLKGRHCGIHTEESFKKISEAMKGERNPNFGMKMSDEQKKKISDKNKKNYKNRKIDNPAALQNQLKGLEKGRDKIRRPIGKYDIQGNFLESYASAFEAGKKNTISHSSIRKVCSGKKSYKTAGGFLWKYLPKETSPS